MVPLSLKTGETCGVAVQCLLDPINVKLKIALFNACFCYFWMQSGGEVTCSPNLGNVIIRDHNPHLGTVFILHALSIFIHKCRTALILVLIWEQLGINLRPIFDIHFEWRLSHTPTYLSFPLLPSPVTLLRYQLLTFVHCINLDK